MSIWDVFLGNKQDAETIGEWLTHAVDHIRNGGNIANCETKLANGIPVKLTIQRMPQASDAGESK